MSSGSLDRFSDALRRLLTASRNYLNTEKTKDDLGLIRSLFAEVQLAAPPNLTIPPFCGEMWPIEEKELGPVSLDYGKTWQTQPHYYRRQCGSWEACRRWIRELEEIAEAALRLTNSPLDAEPLQATAKKTTKNRKAEARDKWMYDQAKKTDKTYRQIMLDLASMAQSKGWRKLGSPQAVEQAIGRYIERNGLTPLPRRIER